MFVHAVELAVVDAEELRVRDLVLARDPPTLSCKRTKKKKGMISQEFLQEFSLLVVVRWTEER